MATTTEKYLKAVNNSNLLNKEITRLIKEIADQQACLARMQSMLKDSSLSI